MIYYFIRETTKIFLKLTETLHKFKITRDVRILIAFYMYIKRTDLHFLR